MAKATENTQEIVKTEPLLNTEQYREIKSFDDAIAVLRDANVTPANAAEELGDGFALLDDKEILCGVELIIVSWDFHPGDFGNDFVSAHVVTADGRRYIVNDGSTGMCQQLKDWTARTGSHAGMYAPKGLRKSEYDNDFGHATTFYVNTSA